MNVAVRYVNYHAKWPWRPPKEPKRDVKGDFDIRFHDGNERGHFGRKNTYQNTHFKTNGKTRRKAILCLSSGPRQGANPHSLSIGLSENREVAFAREFTYPNALALNVESVRL